MADGVGSAALLMVDLDHLERLSDEHGHLGGDEVLRVVGRCLREAAASVAGNSVAGNSVAGNSVAGNKEAGGMAARYGGEEFALVLTGPGAQDALSVAEAVRADVREKCARAGFAVTASVGVARYPDYGSTATTLVAAADAALYAAKAAGRDRTVVAQTSDADEDVVLSR